MAATPRKMVAVCAISMDGLGMCAGTSRDARRVLLSAFALLAFFFVAFFLLAFFLAGVAASVWAEVGRFGRFFDSREVTLCPHTRREVDR